MSITLKIEGAREIEEALLELKATTAKAAVNRTLKKAANPFVAAATARAPDDPDTNGAKDLKENIIVSTSLTKVVRTKNKYNKAEEAHVYAGVGTGAKPYAKATVAEYGSFKQVANPYLRPSWEATKEIAWQIIITEISNEIEKSAKSARKRGNLR